MEKVKKVKKVTLSGMLFAIGLILPFFIGQIPAVGKMLLPMHIPVLICGLILGVNVYLANAHSLAGNQLPMPFGYRATLSPRGG